MKALIKKLFRAIFDERRDQVRLQFNRVLPLNELFTDRWEKARYLHFGEGTSVYDSCLVFGNVRVGRNTWVGPFTILDGSGGLEIGSNCSISAGVHIYTHNTVQWAISKGQAKYEYSPVRIGDACFIGPQAIIQNGVTIGEQCVVAANSFVNKDVPPRSIVGGNPARVIGHVRQPDSGAPRLVFERGQDK